MVDHTFSKFCHNLTSKDNLVSHLGISKIQISVFQSGCLIRFLGTVDFKGKLVIDTFTEYGNILGNHLDLSGGKISILAGTLSDHAGNGKSRLVIYAV